MLVEQTKVEELEKELANLDKFKWKQRSWLMPHGDAKKINEELE